MKYVTYCCCYPNLLLLSEKFSRNIFLGGLFFNNLVCRNGKKLDTCLKYTNNANNSNMQLNIYYLYYYLLKVISFCLLKIVFKENLIYVKENKFIAIYQRKTKLDLMKYFNIKRETEK